MSIHVNPLLDQDKRIIRRISLYDFVELMTFGQLFFEQPARARPAAFHPAVKKRKTVHLMTAPSATGLHHGIAPPIDVTRWACQSWAFLSHEHAIDWGSGEASDASIHMVSTIRSLANSLFVSDDMEVLIDPGAGFDGPPMQTRSAVVPILQDGTLAMTLWRHPGNKSTDPTRLLPLSIALNTMLAGILLPPQATDRFVALVSTLVQRSCHARVSRACLSRQRVCPVHGSLKTLPRTNGFSRHAATAPLAP